MRAARTGHTPTEARSRVVAGAAEASASKSYRRSSTRNK